MDRFSGTQVTTDLEFMAAMYDYIAAQLEGRFVLEYPDFVNEITPFAESLRNPMVRIDAGGMKFALAATAIEVQSDLLKCSLDGCPHEENHKFKREFLDLVYDARQLTAEWLKGQGIVPGQSTN